MTPRVKYAVALAVAVLAIAAVGDVFLTAAARHVRDDRSARQEAMQAARKVVPELLSYDYKSLTADLAHARKTTTGKFSNDFDKLVRTVIEPTAASKHVATSAVVSSAGVISSTSDRVTVLVFVTQTSTSSVRKSPAVTGSRVKVVMVRTGGHWLIAGLDPV